jgi:hypothetical protein
MAEDGEKKKKDRPEVPLTRDTVLRRRNARQDVHKESPLTTLQEIFEETNDKSRFVGDTMFWKYFEDIDIHRVMDTKSVEYLNLRFMFCETAFYVLLVILFTAYAYSLTSLSVFEARNAELNYWGGCNLETGDCTIKEAKDMASFWSWMSNEFVPKAFTEYTPTAPEVAQIQTTFSSNEFPLTWSPRFIGPNRANLLLGTVRVKQLRVKKNMGCEVSSLYAHVFPDCYGKFTSVSEDRENFRPRFVPSYLTGAYKYQSATETTQISQVGEQSEYPGGGFIIDLPVNKTDSLVMINDLKQWYWIDKSTRGIVLEFTTLNVNINVLVNNRILFEFGATGSVTPIHDCTAAQVFFFQASQKAGNAFNAFILQMFAIISFGIQTLYCFFLMYKTCMNFLGGSASFGRACRNAIHMLKKKPFTAMWKGTKLFFRTFYHFLRYEWNLMDFLILSLWYVHTGFRFMTYSYKAFYPNLAPEAIGHPEKFMPFSVCLVPLIRSMNVISVLSILVWMKSFKYLCMLNQFRLLVRILEKCAKELVVFAIVLLFVFAGFAVCFFVAYGATDANFSTISGSFLVLFFLLMDGYRVDPWWFAPGKLQIMPIIFFIYIIIVYFILLNVFLAIVLDVFSFTNHLFVVQLERIKERPNPMMVFIRTYIAWLKGISLIRNEHEESMRSEDLCVDLDLLPGLVRRKWIEKKRKMQRVADQSFAGLCLFPEDEGLLFETQKGPGTDWMLPNSRMDMAKMINAQPSKPVSIYDIPMGMMKQTISRSQLQRLMDQDNSLPLLLGTSQAVQVIRKFRRKALGEEFDENEEQEESNDPSAHNPVNKTQAQVFQRIDELERVPPDVELTKIPQIVGMTEDMSHALSEVQNQFRVQLTGIIEATANLFEHLVELTQGVDAVRNNHEEVLGIVREVLAQEDYGEGSSEMTGSRR